MKKLAKLLVGCDAELFPLCEEEAQAFQGQPAPEIRVIAARFKKKHAKSEKLLHDPDHVRTLVVGRLAQFSYLNDPPTITVSASYAPSHLRPNHLAG